ncbi:hypothetical protein [Oceanibaculum nanhaiense]|uniref:hypothetical protein n=1 Tax=Oceanibaculum nanhaiense TaxID=1909734 RepID=UPI003D2A37B6
MRDEKIPVHTPECIEKLTIKTLMDRVTRTGNEWIAAYSENTKKEILLCTECSPKFCGVSSDVSCLLSTEESSVYHNHPSNKPFSSSDFTNFLYNYERIISFHACGNDGKSVFSLSNICNNDIFNKISEIEIIMQNIITGYLFCQSDPVLDYAVRHGFGLGLDKNGIAKYEYNIHNMQYDLRKNNPDVQIAQIFTVDIITLFLEIIEFHRNKNKNLDMHTVRPVVHNILNNNVNFKVCVFRTHQLNSCQKDIYESLSNFKFQMQ